MSPSWENRATIYSRSRASCLTPGSTTPPTKLRLNYGDRYGHMARVQALGRDALPPEFFDLWDEFSSPPNDFSNQTAVLAHSPVAFGTSTD